MRLISARFAPQLSINGAKTESFWRQSRSIQGSMNTNAAIPSIVNRKVFCAGKICGLGLHPQAACASNSAPMPARPPIRRSDLLCCRTPLRFSISAAHRTKGSTPPKSSVAPSLALDTTRADPISEHPENRASQPKSRGFRKPLTGATRNWQPVTVVHLNPAQRTANPDRNTVMKMAA